MRLCEKDDPERCRTYRERARIFAQDFIYWFGTRGEALPSGQYAGWEPAFTAEKYEKFAYSSAFGFQVSRAYNELHLTAPDNMLAFYKDGLYHVRRRCESVACEEDRILSVWKPLDDVTVETELRLCDGGHIRKHRITSKIECTAVPYFEYEIPSGVTEIEIFVEGITK